MTPTEQQIRNVRERERLNKHIVCLWLQISEKSVEFLTDSDAAVFQVISAHPAIQSKLNTEETKP
jgi:hypothetical protein